MTMSSSLNVENHLMLISLQYIIHNNTIIIIIIIGVYNIYCNMKSNIFTDLVLSNGVHQELSA